MNRIIYLATACLALAFGEAQIHAATSAVESGAIYEISVRKIETRGNASIQESTVTARLRTTPMADGKTSIILEMKGGPASLYQVPASSLPPELGSIANGRDLWFNTAKENSRFDEPIRFDLTNGQPEGGKTKPQKVYPVTVYDGTGNPTTDVIIDVLAGSYKLYTAKPDANGHMNIIVPATFAKSNPYHMIPNPFEHIKLRATDASGQVEELGFPTPVSSRPPITLNWEDVTLSLVPRDTKSPVFRGRIQQADGSPAANIGYSMHWLSFPGMGGVQFQHGSTLKAAPDGTICVGIPLNFLRASIGGDSIPPKSELQISLPSSTRGHMTLDKENIIQIQFTKKLQFKLLATDGTPLLGLKQNYSGNGDLRKLRNPDDDTERSEYISGSIRVADAENAIIDVGEVPVPGFFSFEYNGIRFKPRAITADEGNGLPVVWQVSSQRKAIQGRVLAAESGAPLPDVYVLFSNEGSTDDKLVNFSTDQLEMLLKQWQEKSAKDTTPQKHDLEYGELKIVYSVLGMMKTSASGTFSLPFAEGSKPNGFHVFVPGRMGASAELYKWRTDSDGNYTLPDVALPLAGSIKASATAPDRVPDQYLAGNDTKGTAVGSTLMIGAAFDRYTSQTGLAVDLPQLNSSKSYPWILITHTGWISPGSVATIPVPAGIPFSISASAPNTPTLGGVSWPKQSPIQPGEIRELGSQTLRLRTPFVIHVTNPDGSPAQGISIRLDGQLPSTTDADGNAIGWADGVVGRIEAYKDKSTWKSAARLDNVDVEALPEPRTVNIILK